VQPHALDGERGQNDLPEPLRARLRLVEATFRDQDGELVAAEPGEDVAGAQPGLEPRPHLPQQLVAGVVPEAVVDLLEAVEVEQQEGGGPAGGGGRQDPLALEQQRPPVGEAGELVGAGLLLHLVEGADLAERDRRPRDRGEDGGDRQPRGGRRQGVAPSGREHEQAGDVAGERQGEQPPADA
jgi:hypothetical protein